MHHMYAVIQLSLVIYNYEYENIYVERRSGLGIMLGIETQYVSSLFKWLTWLWYIYHQVPFIINYILQLKCKGINVYMHFYLM